MIDSSERLQPEAFTDLVRELVCARLRSVGETVGEGQDVRQLAPGKMLRTRLAARLAETSPASAAPLTLRRACAATELVHTASLCHDDVIDNAFVRRSRPTLWKEIGSTSAVLIGDLLLCDAMLLVMHTEDGRYSGAFVNKVQEVCMVEAEHELRLRGKQLDESTCLHIARGKTGPLFAFAALVCGGDDEALSAALEEVGYEVGTAYQFADDIFDIVADEVTAGKTLRTDVARRKFTLPQMSERGRSSAEGRVVSLCASARERLSGWPKVQAAFADFLRLDLQPVFAKLHQSTALYLEVGT